MKQYGNFSGLWELCAYSDAEYVRNNYTWKRVQDTSFLFNGIFVECNYWSQKKSLYWLHNKNNQW